MSEIVAEKLIDIESVQFSFNKHFTLTSGLKSPVYVDCRKIISFIDERDFIMNEAVEYFKKNNLKVEVEKVVKHYINKANTALASAPEADKQYLQNFTSMVLKRKF